MKQKIISGIVGKLAVMGISVTCGNNSDIAINTEFLDAEWSTGSKKIRYEALIFANEKNNIVYMYEKTTEIGHGLSFGSDSGTSFQSGKTLFRKVKSVQYSPDGKAYEYILDLGAISKAVKETAKLYGWGFKTVINKNKAMYPAGYVPSFARTDKEVHDRQPAQSSNGYCSNCGIPLENGAKFCNKCGNPIAPEYAQPTAGTNMPTPQQKTAEEFGQEPKYDNQQTEFYAKAQKKSAQKGKVLGLIIFILLGVVRLAKIFEAEITLAGWIFSVVIFSAALFIQKKIKKRGRLAKFILWLVTVFILAIGLAIFSKNNSGVSTAKIENAHMTTAMNAEGRPVDEVYSYLPSTRELVAAAELHNAPPHTQVKFVWHYITEGLLVSEYTMDSGEKDDDVYVFSYLTNDKAWPEGKYRVDIYVADRETQDADVEFTIGLDEGKTGTQASSARLSVDLLPYEKSFPLDDGKSIGTFKIFVSDGTGGYENCKGETICEFSVKFDTSSLPSDFKMRPEQADERDTLGAYALDGLIMAVCSDKEAYHCSSLAYGQYIFNNGNIRPFSETNAATTNVNAEDIIELAHKYPKIQVLRYNVNEVGMTQEGDTWITHSEKAFGLHPPITEGNIPWDEILNDLRLK